LGHRKKHAPRRGSLAFRPRARAKSMVPRIKFWPQIAEPKLLGFAGYKAGMTHAFIIEADKRSPNYGKEVFIPATVVETPPLTVCALRLYEETAGGLRTLYEVWAEKLPKELGRLLTLPKNYKAKESLSEAEKLLTRACDVRVLTCTNLRSSGLGKKTPELMEIAVGGQGVREKWEYAVGLLGKQVNVGDVFQEGQYVDVVAVSKGKGFAGVVKRYGIRRKEHKSRKTVREVGCIGPWHPPTVMWTVPRAGQLGFHRRTEYGKQIIKIGADGKEVTPKGGFHKYGVIKGPYIVLRGSIPGHVKRLIRLRHSVRAPEEAVKPEITYLKV